LGAAILLFCSFSPRAVVLGKTMEVYQTTEKSSDRLAHKPSVDFTPKKASGVHSIKVDSTKLYQKIEGFGGAITDSTAQVFASLNSSLQSQVIEALWGPTGQQYNLMRLTIGATDFSTSLYNYAETKGDYKMKDFSMAHDEKYIIPMIKRAQNSNPEMEFLATPWSPPAWLKSNGKMRNSKSPGLNQDSKSQKAYALYLSEYLSAMAAENITISRLTVQNEPHVKGQFAATYPCCGFTAEQERDFLRDYLGPKMRADHPDVEIYIHDDQKDIMVDFVSTVMSDNKTAQYVDGVAFHWYGANLKNYQYLEQLHKMFPSLPLLATEATLEAPTTQHIGSTPWKEAMKYAIDIIGDLNAWTSGWIEWNVLLDSSGGPTCIGPSATSVCTPLVGHCDAPILANANDQTIELRDSYWHMAHFSRFISRGSVRIGVDVADKFADSVKATAVVTKGEVDGDEKVTIVVLNTDGSNTQEYQVELGGEFATLKIPPHSIQTLVVS